MSTVPTCPVCGHFVFLDLLSCPNCETSLGYNLIDRHYYSIEKTPVEIDGATWYPCTQRGWGCNWLVRADAPAGRCLSCRMTRQRPESDDTLALEKLATTEQSKRRLLLQLLDLRLPIRPWDSYPGGLGFDLLSSRSTGEKVLIGHANGIITIDLAESLDDHREALRIRLGEPYRTMLGHLRHEVGHYFENVLVATPDLRDRCRELFGDERADYRAALTRHYREGAPPGWDEAFISEYATMHPWEDFAETFAHYLHITGTLETAAMIGIRLEAGVANLREADVVPLESYLDETAGRMLSDWEWMSQAFNRINRAMGLGDLYPFDLVDPVRRKLAFVHELVGLVRLTPAEQITIALPGRDFTHGAVGAAEPVSEPPILGR